MHSIVISDTSCFIILSKIGELNILKDLYSKVYTTTVIAEEYGDVLPDWVEVVHISDENKQRLLEIQIDKGEASALVFALENPGSIIILDDNKARKIALQLGITITGTFGVIVKAKLNGIIPTVKPIIDKIRQTNFRISLIVEEEILRQAGE
ncbi:MAG: DUF3368 domain-containing protein [Sphingobacteriales bacterium]|nr:MAG: DUF3368 domain-containing protein [Sphingobacteriales bacterium]